MTDVLLDIQQLSKTYALSGTSVPALRDLSFQVRAGEFVAITGHSGAGKSTLLNMISGVDAPSGGSVLIGGQSIQRLSETARARWRGRSLGIVFQFFALLPTLTLLNNVTLPMEMIGSGTPATRRARAEALLASVGLADQIHKLPSRVSGGQQQRAAVARALANDPPLILGDEPTGNLDSGSAQLVFALFTQLAAEGKTILMVTQDAALAAGTTRQLELRAGALLRDSAAAATAPI